MWWTNHQQHFPFISVKFYVIFWSVLWLPSLIIAHKSIWYRHATNLNSNNFLFERCHGSCQSMIFVLNRKFRYSAHLSTTLSQTFLFTNYIIYNMKELALKTKSVYLNCKVKQGRCFYLLCCHMQLHIHASINNVAVLTFFVCVTTIHRPWWNAAPAAE